jgi:DNA processing protein
MTTIDKITREAGPLANAYEPEALARAFWTHVTEPADTVAGELIATLGAIGALDVAIGTPEVTDSEELTTLKDRVQSRANRSQFEQILRSTAQYGVQLITPESDHWPTGLNDLGNAAPFALWVRGNVELLAGADQIAIVGARAATGYGEHVTMEIASGLSDRGRTIVSGAAYGIDGMAHRAALASHGQTVAYLAGGVDRYYPSGHDALLTRIADQGAVVSEVPVGTPPTKWHFLARNRLLAAATHATIVVEAGMAVRIAQHRWARTDDRPSGRGRARTDHQPLVRWMPPPHPRLRRHPRHQHRRSRRTVGEMLGRLC